MRGSGTPNVRRRMAGILGLITALGLAHPLSAQPVPDTIASPPERIVVSLSERRLWLLQGTDTLFTTAVAVGRQTSFRFDDRTYVWRTPKGTRRVLRKEVDPAWTVPDWHYYERSAAEGLELVKLHRGRKYAVKGTYLEVRGRDVGWVGEGGSFHPIQPGREIVIDGTLYVPPADTRQRDVPGALGPFALDLGDGYLIHGTNTYNAESIGEAASHGCIRLDNADVEALYGMVEVGTPVTIY